MILVGECRGWDLFPVIPSQSRFNRRRRNLMDAINLIRQAVLQVLDLAQDRYCLIDSLPIPVVEFHLVPSSTGDWSGHGADFGKVSSKKLTIFGYKLHLLVTISGVIVDFILAPASATDLKVGEELLNKHTDLEVFGDKAFISAPLAAQLAEQNRVLLHTLPRSNQKVQVPPPVRRLHNQVRQMIETVNAQLDGQFHIETNHAYIFWGLCTRLLSKLTAHTLSIYLNRLLGADQPLHIKALAFPN